MSELRELELVIGARELAAIVVDECNDLFAPESARALARALTRIDEWDVEIHQPSDRETHKRANQSITVTLKRRENVDVDHSTRTHLRQFEEYDLYGKRRHLGEWHDEEASETHSHAWLQQLHRQHHGVVPSENVDFPEADDG